MKSKSNLWFTTRQAQGRPREVVLTPEQAKRFCQLVQLANKDRHSGSASMAWRVLLSEYPEIDWSPLDRASKHQIPTVAVELARKAQALTGYHRQGERGLRKNAPYVKGLLRKQQDGVTRMLSGAHVSYDDGTINIPVVIPWPQGGCPLSNKHQVKVGRFQLLCPHDEGSSYVPSFEFVIRDSQGYRGVDASGAALRFLRDILLPDAFVFEGGVWQGKRMQRVLSGAGVGLVDVKGRPWQKMIENFYNRLWTRLALCPGLASVGRFRGEEKAVSEFYVKCRAGKADPRGVFPWLNELLAGLETSIRWLNEDRIESGPYGKWVPIERWNQDMAEHPRQTLCGDMLWLAAPVMEKRKVCRGTVKVTTVGWLGMKMEYQFSGTCLWEWEGKEVEIYFDPLGAWPVQGVVTRPGKAVALGEVECINPVHEGGTGADGAKAVREMMRREYRQIWGGGKHFETSNRETVIRNLDGVVEVKNAGKTEGGREETNFGAAASREGEGLISRTKTEDRKTEDRREEIIFGAGDRHVDVPAPTRGGAEAEVLRSLGRRAAAARELAGREAASLNF